MPTYRVSIDVICNSYVVVDAVSPEAASTTIEEISAKGAAAIREFLRAERADLTEDAAAIQVSDVEEEEML